MLPTATAGQCFQSSHSPCQKQREHCHPSTVPPGLREAPASSSHPGKTGLPPGRGPQAHTWAALLSSWGGGAVTSCSEAGLGCRAWAQGGRQRGWQVPAGLRGAQGTVWACLGAGSGVRRLAHAPALDTPCWPLQRARPCFPWIPPRRVLGAWSGLARLLRDRNLGHRGGEAQPCRGRWAPGGQEAACGGAGQVAQRGERPHQSSAHPRARVSPPGSPPSAPHPAHMAEGPGSRGP